MAGKTNIKNLEEDVLELIYKIINDDEIINLKEGNVSHYKLDDDGIDVDDVESLKENSGYKNFKDSLKKLQLSSMIKKVNVPKIEQSISIYCHENDLLTQSLALDIVFLLRPLLSLSVNIIKENNNYEEEKIQIIKDYFEEALKHIKNQSIKKFFSSKGEKKYRELFDADDLKNNSLKQIIKNKQFAEIKDDLELFNESLIQHLAIWIKLSMRNFMDNSEIDNLEPKELKLKISNMMDDFFEKNMNEILNRIQF